MCEPTGRLAVSALDLPSGRYQLGRKVGTLSHALDRRRYHLDLDDGPRIDLWPGEAREQLRPLAASFVHGCAQRRAEGLYVNLFRPSTWTGYLGVRIQGSGGVLHNELRVVQHLRHHARLRAPVTLLLRDEAVEIDASDLWFMGLYGAVPRLPVTS